MTRRDQNPPSGRPQGFVYRQDARNAKQTTLHCEQVPLTILAAKYGTPLYVYSAAMIRERYATFSSAFRNIQHTVCYSVKANSNLSVLRLLALEGCGFDVVSGGELQRVLTVNPKLAGKTVFSGVGKTHAEIKAALKARIMLFNVESEAELSALAESAARSRIRANVALRVNPDVAAKTHPYISTGLHQHKFGVPITKARGLYAEAARSKLLTVAGVSVHIGSQITDVAPFGEAMARVAELVRELRSDGHCIRYIDAGGGLGISYEQSDPREFAERSAEYAEALISPLRGLGIHLLLEPGRSIVGPAGVLAMSVVYRKSNQGKKFVVVDAAMNDLIRPALYGAHHEILPVKLDLRAKPETVDVVGPVCETGDFFARDRKLPAVEEGDVLAILDAGAYGMVLASNYNTRPRAAEVLVSGKSVKVIRKRETISDLIRAEI